MSCIYDKATTLSICLAPRSIVHRDRLGSPVYIAYIQRLGMHQMVQQINIDVAIDAIRHGFEPLACAVEVHDFENQIDLRALGPDHKPVARVLGVAVHDVTNREATNCDRRGACLG